MGVSSRPMRARARVGTQRIEPVRLLNSRHSKGVTLLELMIVITLVGILAVGASAAYRGYVDRARVEQAKQEIAYIALEVEKFDTRPDRPNGGFPNTLAELGLDPSYFLDPWGHPYRYQSVTGVGGARKDHNNVQLNNDFDLYSVGKNGDTNQTFTSTLSQDDIVRGLNGSYIGTPAEYAQLPDPY